MLVTCSIGRTSHQSLILYTVARLDTRWRDIEDGNGLPVTDYQQPSSLIEDRNLLQKSLKKFARFSASITENPQTDGESEHLNQELETYRGLYTPPPLPIKIL